MPLSDLKTDGFSEEMQHYATMTRPGDMYVQGFALRQCGVWLRIDGGECRGHDLEFCPRHERITDPYGTGDHWYVWIEHGCEAERRNK